MIELYRELYSKLSTQRRRQINYIIFLTIFVAVFDVLNIGAAIPFLYLLASPEKIEDIKLLSSMLKWTGFAGVGPNQLLITLAFSGSVIIAGVLKFSLLIFQTRVSFNIGADISREILKKTLAQPYEVHASRNSGDIITTITLKANALASMSILPAITLLASGGLFIIIFTALCFYNIRATLSILTIFILLYYLIHIRARVILKKSSFVADINQNRLVKAIQQSLLSIRNVIIDDLHDKYINSFVDADIKYRQSAGNIHIVTGGPKFLIESAGLVILAAFAYSFVKEGRSGEAIAMVGVFALAAQKMLPYMQQMFASYSTMIGGKDSLLAVLELTSQPMGDAEKVGQIKFENEIRLRNVSFMHSNGVKILENINVVFASGMQYGLVGKTGAGKSTLVDLVMGLHSPLKGDMLVDNNIICSDNLRAWRRNIMHVPQHVNIIDSSILENIILGSKEKDVDLDKFIKVCKIAEIYDYINSLNDKEKTLVGENGVMLSGGQIQRIGIARALYKDASLLVLDEATSALDVETEGKIINNIKERCKGKTILMISHREASLVHCDQIYLLESCGVRKVEKVRSNV